MSIMTKYRLLDLNLVYKVMEIMESTTVGFVLGKYRVIDGFPNELDFKQSAIWPTITVEIDRMFGRDVELGSKQWPGFTVAIDVLANTDSQRDDISSELWEQLNEINFDLFNFNSAFPSTAGGGVDYTGIPILGDWYIDNLTITAINDGKDSQSRGLRHHSVIDGIMYLPNI